MKKPLVVVSVVVLALLLGGYFGYLKPNQEAADWCASGVVYRPATEGTFGSSAHHIFNSHKYEGRDDAMEACKAFLRKYEDPSVLWK